MNAPLRVLLLVAGFLCAASSGGIPVHAEQHVASDGPRQIALQPREVPAGYVRYLARTTTNGLIARENGVPVTVYNKIGRVIGFETGYRGRTGFNGAHPLCCINVQVVQYRSAAGAEQAFLLGQQMVKNTYGRDRGFRALNDGMGTTAAQMFPCHCGKAAKQTVYIITTHLRNFLVSTEIHFAAGTNRQKISDTAANFQSLMVARVP